MFNTSDNVALNELLVLLAHRDKRGLYLGDHLLEFVVDLGDLFIQTNIVLRELINAFNQG
jgi:hypothetical protein